MADMNNATELRAKKTDELEGQLGDLKKEQFNLRFQRASGQLSDTTQFRRVRRNIARIRTILRERRDGAAS
jgi:large subunit ribosomal protein L29